jgi:L-seryl-tRNA(Ser) seleniumtransferase
MMADDFSPTHNADPYLALGVRPFINCCSVRTVHGGSLMLPQVRQAVAAASRQFVNLDELMEAAGARLAELTGAEWGIVTCGSAAAVALGTAACVAGNDPVKMLRLPFTDGMPNRVVMVRNQRFAYDQAIRMIGTRIVEIDTHAELEAALAEPVAMIAALGTHEAQSRVRLEDLVAAARPRGIPILVDAASEHLQRPSPWLARGADLVVYSGGKFLRGPQTSGLLLGRKALVQAAWRNASPHQALGRPMKVSKEDVIGVLAAVEHWFEQREETAERARWQADCEMIARAVARVKGVSSEVLSPAGVVAVPALRVQWDRAQIALDGLALRQALLEGTPRIMLDDMAATENSVVVDPFGLQPGEATEVGRAIAAALANGRPPAAPLPATVNVSGAWELRTRFLHGERLHRLDLRQQGNALTGGHRSPQFEGGVTGSVSGDAVRFDCVARYEGSNVTYRFRGTATDDAMRGEVAFGTSNDHHQGPVNLVQFGEGSWEARRLS